MTITILSPKNARNNFYQLLKDVNTNHREIHIMSEISDNNAVLISLEKWQAIQETLKLEQTGVLTEVRKREKDDSGFTKVGNINWDTL